MYLYRVRGLVRNATLAGLMTASGPALAAQDKSPTEASDYAIDRVELAARMIGDGHYGRAATLLREVDPEAVATNRKKLYTLLGVLQLREQRFAKAIDSFQQAIREGQDNPAVQLYLAQSLYGAERYAECLDALSRAKEESNSYQGVLMKAQAEWELGKHLESVRTLSRAMAAFPNQDEFLRLKLFRLAELGLFQEVSSLAEQYLGRVSTIASDFVAVGEALRAGGQFEEAQRMLERARLEYPENEEISLQLAHSYLDAEQPVSAAMIFETEAMRNPKYSLEAAELFKGANRISRALRNNARVPEQKAKLKQRLSLLLAREEFEKVSAMSPALSRLGLLSDDDIRYALAFAHFNTGQFEASERHLSLIVDPKLFEASLQLRRAIQSCRQTGWECEQ